MVNVRRTLLLVLVLAAVAGVVFRPQELNACALSRTPSSPGVMTLTAWPATSVSEVDTSEAQRHNGMLSGGPCIRHQGDSLAGAGLSVADVGVILPSEPVLSVVFTLPRVIVFRTHADLPIPRQPPRLSDV